MVKRNNIITFLITFLMLGVMITSCGKDVNSEDKQNKGQDIEQNPAQEEEPMETNSDSGEETDAQAEEAYFEVLAAGNQICPTFPEVERLAQVDEQFLLDSICPTVVRLESGNLFGSGVIWKMEEESIWILTNQHVLAETSANMADTNETLALIDVIFWDGIRTYGEIVETSEEYDLGILRVNLKDMGYHTVERYFSVRYDEASFKTLNPGDDLFIIGSADYPAGNLYYGTIGNRSIYMDNFGTEMLWAYCEVKAGMSGSGVFDQKGNLIGIVCAGNEQKEAAVLPIDKILAEWEVSGY